MGRRAPRARTDARRHHTPRRSRQPEGLGHTRPPTSDQRAPRLARPLIPAHRADRRGGALPLAVPRHRPEDHRLHAPLRLRPGHLPARHAHLPRPAPRRPHPPEVLRRLRAPSYEPPRPRRKILLLPRQPHTPRTQTLPPPRPTLRALPHRGILRLRARKDLSVEVRTPQR